MTTTKNHLIITMTQHVLEHNIKVADLKRYKKEERFCRFTKITQDVREMDSEPTYCISFDTDIDSNNKVTSDEIVISLVRSIEPGRNYTINEDKVLRSLIKQGSV